MADDRLADEIATCLWDGSTIGRSAWHGGRGGALARTTRPPPSACLSEDEILAFGGGQLRSESLRHVDAHLDVCATCRKLVAGVVHGWSTPSRWAFSRRHGRLCPGRLLAGRYRVERLVGRGGMGEVYAALDLERGQRLALKVPLPSLLYRDEALAQLSLEAELGRRLRHPNICKVHELCVHEESGEEPLPFLTMELIEGERLADRLRRRKLTTRDVTRIARQLLVGLSTMHEIGVLHLDFKSDNVLLRKTVSPDEAMIVDFGLSQNARSTAKVRRKTLAGSFGYMAPDQVLGLRPSAQADVFSFGVVLFEMLTRRPPFVADGRSAWRSIATRVAEPPPAPSRFEAGVPPALDEFVLRCLAGRRSRRYSDASVALESFDRLTPSLQTTC